MYRKHNILLTLGLILGCIQPAPFISVGNEKYPPKPDDYKIQVFFSDDLPEREYKVIGMIFLEEETGFLLSSTLGNPRIIKRFKKTAKIQGADAIIITKIGSDYEVLPITSLDINVKKMARSEAQAIIFTNDNDVVK